MPQCFQLILILDCFGFGKCMYRIRGQQEANKDVVHEREREKRQKKKAFGINLTRNKPHSIKCNAKTDNINGKYM